MCGQSRGMCGGCQAVSPDAQWGTVQRRDTTSCASSHLSTPHQKNSGTSLRLYSATKSRFPLFGDCVSFVKLQLGQGLPSVWLVMKFSCLNTSSATESNCLWSVTNEEDLQCLSECDTTAHSVFLSLPVIWVVLTQWNTLTLFPTEYTSVFSFCFSWHIGGRHRLSKMPHHFLNLGLFVHVYWCYFNISSILFCCSWPVLSSFISILIFWHIKGGLLT